MSTIFDFANTIIIWFCQYSYTHDPSGHLIDERTTTGTYYYLFDGLGSVVGLTDSTGALVGNETYQYDPYGQLIHQPRTAALRTNAWRYASGYYDVSTGLYKFGIRYYDATTGRWTQRDPVGGSLLETTKVNPYVYAGDDPVNETDLSGENGLLCGITIGILVVGVLVGAWLAISAIVTAPVGWAFFVEGGIALSATGQGIVGGIFTAISGITGGIAALIAGA